MTVKELKNKINSIDKKYDNEEIIIDYKDMYVEGYCSASCSYSKLLDITLEYFKNKGFYINLEQED